MKSDPWAGDLFQLFVEVWLRLSHGVHDRHAPAGTNRLPGWQAAGQNGVFAYRRQTGGYSGFSSCANISGE